MFPFLIVTNNAAAVNIMCRFPCEHMFSILLGGLSFSDAKINWWVQILLVFKVPLNLSPSWF